MKLAVIAWVALSLGLGCGDKAKPEDWKERPGPGFVITAPYAAELVNAPKDAPVKMVIYQYVNKVTEAWQVQVADMPPDREPAQVIANMRQHVKSTGTVEQEKDVEMGDTTGADFRYITDMPPMGKMYVRNRIVMKNHKVYQVMIVHRPEDKARDAPADRFVDSFRLTD
jgi:hypothetical protein